MGFLFYIGVTRGETWRGQPKGSVKKRVLGGGVYYYLQYRQGPKVVQKYVGKEKPLKLEKLILERRSLRRQLRDVIQSLKLLSRVKASS